MTTPQVFSPNRSVRCPVCGTDRLSVSSERDSVDSLFQTPGRVVKRLLGAPLYHCQVCRIQFYDTGEIVSRGEPNGIEVAPGRIAEQDASIGKSVTIRGSVVAAQNVFWNGVIEGPVVIPAHRLTIGPAGRVIGNVQAGEVVAMGTVRGDIVARSRVALRAGANVIGNIRTASISIEDGAYFKGRVEMS
jgi:cytoskeletal protein CcmA (bactofilin family)